MPRPVSPDRVPAQLLSHCLPHSRSLRGGLRPLCCRGGPLRGPEVLARAEGRVLAFARVCCSSRARWPHVGADDSRLTLPQVWGQRSKIKVSRADPCLSQLLRAPGVPGLLATSPGSAVFA